MIRPRRQAAIVASIKIQQYYHKHVPTVSVERCSRTSQVLITRECIRDYLNDAEKYPDRKIDIIIQMLQHLINHPMILLVHPRFREVTSNKMDEFEVSMQSFLEFKKKIADMQETIQRSTNSMKVREEIMSHLHDINRLHSSCRIQKNTMGYDKLLSTIEQLRSMIKEMPSHPDYVSK
jgi:hypothetical protein